MKKVLKRIVIVAILFVLFVGLNTTFAKLGAGFEESYMPADTNDAGKFGEIAGNVLATLQVIVEVAAVIGVAVTGVQYMYADGQSKAKIKQTLIWVIVGTVFIFAAPKVVELVENLGGEIVP